MVEPSPIPRVTIQNVQSELDPASPKEPYIPPGVEATFLLVGILDPVGVEVEAEEAAAKVAKLSPSQLAAVLGLPDGAADGKPAIKALQLPQPTKAELCVAGTPDSIAQPLVRARIAEAMRLSPDRVMPLNISVDPANTRRFAVPVIRLEISIMSMPGSDEKDGKGIMKYLNENSIGELSTAFGISVVCRPNELVTTTTTKPPTTTTQNMASDTIQRACCVCKNSHNVKDANLCHAFSCYGDGQAPYCYADYADPRSHPDLNKQKEPWTKCSTVVYKFLVPGKPPGFPSEGCPHTPFVSIGAGSVTPPPF